MTRAISIWRVTAMVFVASAAAGWAQPDWVQQVAKNAATLSHHKEAHAAILYLNVDITLAPNNAQTHVQKIVRILHPDAQKFGSMLEALTPFREIKNLKGWALRPEGDTRTLNKENIVQISPSGSRDDGHVLVATLPGVKPGVLVAYEYDIEETGATSSYQSFVFQEQQSVQFVRLVVRVPTNWALHQAEWHLQGIARTQAPGLYEWTGRDLAYRAEEPLMPSWQFLARRIAFVGYDSTQQGSSHFRDWSSVAKWCAELHDPAARPEPDVVQEALRLTKDLSRPEDKLRRIAEFVRDDIRYVAVEIGKERWQPRTAAQTLYNRYGDCKDKTTLMRALLEAVNIPSVPVLANTSYAVRASLPTPFQFNHCIVGIPAERVAQLDEMPNAKSNGWLFFDPTDLTANLGDLPVVLQGDLVLLATQTDTLLQRLPYRSAENYRRTYQADARLAADGAMSATVRVTDFGDRALATKHYFKLTTPEKQVEEWRALFAQTIPHVVLTDFQSGATSDSAWVSFQLHALNYLKNVAPFFLLKTNFLVTSQAPVLTAEKREHPIWFGPAAQESFSITWTLPQEWMIEEAPAAISNVTAVAQLECTSRAEADSLRFSCVQEKDGRAMPVAEYALARKLSQAQSAASKVTAFLKKR